MSGIFKGVGKVFKKVLKVAIKIAPYALAAAAVVFTGGAALGLLPTFGAAVGGVVSSLGLSAAVTGALTGAITSAGFGAALGFVTGGKKGMQKGALMGALTGGVMGFASPSMFGITTGANGAVTTTNALAHGGDAFGSAKGLFGGGIAPTSATSNALQVPTDLATPPPTSMPGLTQANIDALPAGDFGGGIAPSPVGGVASTIGDTAQQLGQAAQMGGQAATQAASAVGPAGASDLVHVTDVTAPASLPDLSSYSATPVSAASQSGGSNIISQLLGGQGGVGGSPLSLIGNVLSSVAGGKTDEQKSLIEQEKMREKLANFAYGGAYSGKANPMGLQAMPSVPQPRYYYDASTNQVVDRQQPQGA